MNRRITCAVAVLALGGLAAVGCDKQTEPAANTETRTTETRTTANPAPTGSGVLDKARDAANNTADAMRNAGNNTADAVRNAGANASTTQPTTGTADAGLIAEAQILYNKATTAISQQHLDEAQGYINKLNDYKTKLPPDWQSRIDTLVTSFNAAKTRLNAIPNVNVPTH